MSEQKEIIVILSTVPRDKSASLARLLVEKRVVACVNVIPVRSSYHWKGEFCDEEEHLLIAKTPKEKAREVIAMIKSNHPYVIKSNHPYEVPEIIALPVIDGYLPYLEWVTQETLDEP